MTTSKRAERLRRLLSAGGIADPLRAAVVDAGRAELRRLGQVDASREFPLVRYQPDPLRFAADVLGVQPIEEQAEIILAIRDDPRVAVSGGRKVGKDFALAIVALWFYACFPGGRVRFTAVTDEQVKVVFWREVTTMVRGAGRCLACKKADPHGPRPCPHSVVVAEEDDIPTLARTGLHRPDGAELVGYTLAEAAGGRGISGGYQLDIVDEASDVEDDRIETIDGNHLGCVVGRTAMLSNPSRTTGQFYRAFHEEAGPPAGPLPPGRWRGFYRSSLEIAKKYGGRVPGLARLDQVEDFVAKHGADSDLVLVHIHGRFPTSSEGKVFPVHAILAAQARHGTTPATGPRTLGIDVAGESGAGDQSAFAMRRGLSCTRLHARRGLSPEAHLDEALKLLAQDPCEAPDELPTVVLDVGGEQGAKVRGVFVAYLQPLWASPPFRLVQVDSSRKGTKYQRKPQAFDRVRDELVGNLADWMRGGGAIPNDPRLARQLNEFRWAEQPVGTANKLVDKRKMRQSLGGESPDLADALALSCWSERQWRPPTAAEAGVELPAPAVQVTPQDANEIWYPGGTTRTAGAVGDDDPNGLWWPKG